MRTGTVHILKSSQTAHPPLSPGSWSKVVDRAGNNYVINYTALTGTAVPHEILWTPTSAGGSSYTYEKMLFNYATNVPQSSINEYVAGTLVSNTELLTSIEILSAGTVVKDYFLAYQASPLTGREELNSITECPNTTESSLQLPRANEHHIRKWHSRLVNDSEYCIGRYRRRTHHSI